MYVYNAPYIHPTLNDILFHESLIIFRESDIISHKREIISCESETISHLHEK